MRGLERGREVAPPRLARPLQPGGNTVIVSKCPTALCSVKVNPDLLTEVLQNEDIRTRRGWTIGASPTSHALTGRTVNLGVDDFMLDTYVRGDTVLPYAYHLPRNYNPRREYPLVVILPGHGMGWDGDNRGVQIAADIPATAWLSPEWTGSREDFIVLAPQNQRVGAPAEAAGLPVRVPPAGQRGARRARGGAARGDAALETVDKTPELPEPGSAPRHRRRRGQP